MKTNKNLALALTIALAFFVTAEKVFADEEEQVIKVEIVQPELTYQQKIERDLEGYNQALDELARQSSIEAQQFVDQTRFQNDITGVNGRLRP
jgi:sensor domain CHASE-containing protein